MAVSESGSRGIGVGEAHGTIATSEAERRIVTFALLMAMAVAALEQTVVSTAMPTIIARLKGIDIYPWIFSAYLLAATVTTPLYGKLADLIGRKRMLLYGLGLFSLGSILSGCARSMPELIGMRVIQGLGAGALGPIVLTMIGDMYTLAQRAKVQGLFSAVWGASSLVGPVLGGVLTDRLSWRWVFFVTVPFSLASAWILLWHVHETIDWRKRPPLDVLGSALLAGGSTALLLAILGSNGHISGSKLLLIGVAFVLLVGFVMQERRAAEPVLPLDLIVQPAIGAAVVGSFLIGAIMFGLETYVPLYIQGVLGGTAMSAGRMMMPLFLAWSISVALAAKVVMRFGFRATSLVGSGLIAAGSCTLALGSRFPDRAYALFAIGMGVIGLGMGPTAMCYLVGVQHAVAWNRRGAATAALLFSRMMGGALGVGALGASLFFALGYKLEESGAVNIDVAAALRPETHERLTPVQLLVVQTALGRSLHVVYVQVAALALLSVVCSSRLAHGRHNSSDEQASTPLADDGLALAAREI